MMMSSSSTSSPHAHTTITTMSSTASATATTVDEQDKTLFGSLHSDVADALAQRVETTVRDAVGNLPQATAERRQFLVTRITQAHDANIDALEYIGKHSLFSIRMHPLMRRRAIVQLYSQEGEVEVDDEESMEEEEEHDAKAPSVYPSVEDIPTQQQLDAMELETKTLRQQLVDARGRRQAAAKQLEEVHVAEQLARLAAGTTQDVSDVYGAVTATVVGRDALAESKTQGLELLDQLEATKRQRPVDDDDDGALLTTAKKPDTKTLEQGYQEDRKALGSVDSLANVHQLLMPSMED